MNYVWDSVDREAYQENPVTITRVYHVDDDDIWGPFPKGVCNSYHMLVPHASKDGIVDILAFAPTPNLTTWVGRDHDPYTSNIQHPPFSGVVEEESQCCCGTHVPIHLTLELVNGAPPVVTSWSPVKWWSPYWPTSMHSPAYQLCEKLKEPLVTWLCVAKRACIPRYVALMVCEWVINTNPCIYTSVTSHLVATDVTLPTNIPVMTLNERSPSIRLTVTGFGKNTYPSQ